jgi:transcriptional regulator with XRE-family HTH domain
MNKLQTIVKRLCEVEGIKMNALANKLGVKAPTLSITLSNDNPRKTTMERFADAFGMSFEDFAALYQNPDAYDIIRRLPKDSSEDGGLMIAPKEQNKSIGISNDDIDITPFTFAEGASEGTPKTRQGERMPTESDNDSIEAHAEFVYEGNTLVADTFLDVMLLVNNLSALEERRTTQGKDAIYQSMLSVLIKQYGTKKEG